MLYSLQTAPGLGSGATRSPHAAPHVAAIQGKLLPQDPSAPLCEDPCGSWPGDRMTAPRQLSWLLGINGCGYERFLVMSSSKREGLPSAHTASAFPGGLGHGATSIPLLNPSRP